MENRREKLQWADEAEVVTAWREQLAEAAENPWLADLLLRHGPRLLKRFIAFYRRLRRLSHRKLWRMRRKLGLSIGAAALLLAMSSVAVPGVHAETFPINADNDVPALIQAINQANANDEPDVIELYAGGTFTLTTADNATHGLSGLPVISSTITIEGNGATIARDMLNGDALRILTVGSTGDLTIEDATITGGAESSLGRGGGIFNDGGTLTIRNSRILTNTAYHGGGLFTQGGEVTIEGSTISGNTAMGTETTISGSGYGGGGIYNDGGTLTIRNSRILTNTAYHGAYGAGLFTQRGEVTIEASAVSGNVAIGDDKFPRGSGGGVHSRGALAVRDSRVVSNTAGAGGGIFAFGNVTIEGSTLSRNRAIGDQDYLIGGGLLLASFDSSSQHMVRDSFISNNQADFGGGIGTLTLGASTPSANGIEEVGLRPANEPEQDASVLDRVFDRLPRRRRNGLRAASALHTAEAMPSFTQDTEETPVTMTVRLENSTISGNVALITGGGAFNYAHGAPDGYAADRHAELILDQCTISGNVAEGSEVDAGRGGGVENRAYGPATADIAINGSTISGNSAGTIDDPEGRGGGVDNYAGEGGVARATISETTVSGNSAGGGRNAAGIGLGGGLLSSAHMTSTVQLTVSDSTISGNIAGGGGEGYSGGAGGGLLSYAAERSKSGTTIRNSTLSGNAAGMVGEGAGYGTALGGGAANVVQGPGSQADMVITDSTISDNHASTGEGQDEGSDMGVAGGVLNYGEYGAGSIEMENCTISGNSAGGEGAADGYGGGVMNSAFSDATLAVRLRHCTISGNEARGGSEGTGAGGGLANVVNPEGGGEYVAEISLDHTAVAGNRATGSDARGNEVYHAGGLVTADGYNLFGHGGETDAEAFAGTFAPTVPSDVNATSDGLNVPLEQILDTRLRDNGGDTETHALVSGSPAVDGGDPEIEAPPEHDQRGPDYPRVVNDVIDIGAYEFAGQPVGGVTLARGLGDLIRPWLNGAALTGVLGAAAALLGLSLRRKE